MVMYGRIKVWLRGRLLQSKGFIGDIGGICNIYMYVRMVYKLSLVSLV